VSFFLKYMLVWAASMAAYKVSGGAFVGASGWGAVAWLAAWCLGAVMSWALLVHALFAAVVWFMCWREESSRKTSS
jgi:hypothetical protein